eukprot:2144159-Pyramimonas_sp.AAC.1
MDLALHGVTDPAIDAHAEVIRIWTVSRWDYLLPVGMIDQVFQEVYTKVTPYTPWTDLQGPGQILVATMRRIGWSA